jgi:hypothetical protein
MKAIRSREKSISSAPMQVNFSRGALNTVHDATPRQSGPTGYILAANNTTDNSLGYR